MKKLSKKMMTFTVASTVMLSSIPVLATELKPDYWAEHEDIAVTEQLAASKPVTLRQMEYLNRGIVAIPSSEGTLISWRFLGTDSSETRFNLYRNGEKITDLPIAKTNYLDREAVQGGYYEVVPVMDNEEISSQSEGTYEQDKQYISIPVTEREGDYIIESASVGDLDGDGEYEIVVRRTPSDMDITTRTCYPILEAYKLDGTHLWTIDIGPNEINEIDINFLVYDFDQDGKAEVVTRSFEGTVDGKGNKIGDVNQDGKEDYAYSIIKFKDRQYLSEGPEFLSVYEGTTGKEVARTELLPTREDIFKWSSYPDAARNVKRASHHLFTVAYLDGITPSIVYIRGAWNGVGSAAWNYNGNDFESLWVNEPNEEDELTNVYGAGYHTIAVADIDFDGKDEVLSGSFAIDEDGQTLYATSVEGTKLGHGDAFDVAVMSPDAAGYMVWACHETKNLPTNIELHDARTGQILWGYTKPKDTGRSRAADIDPTNPGWEMWGSTNTPIHSLDGTALYEEFTAAPVSMNMKLYWDGDLLSELLDHMTLTKWDWVNKQNVTLLDTSDECASICGTKGQNCLTADLFGDWREEVIFKTQDNAEMRIYSTNLETEYRLPTLMHDSTYRTAIAWQNNHYNQPANLSYYLGAETENVPVPEIYTVKDNVTMLNPAYEENPNEHAYMPIKIEERLGDISIEGDSEISGGETFELTVGINHIEQAIYGEDLTLVYDPEILVFKGVEGKESTTVIEQQEDIPGIVRILSMTEKGIGEQTELLKLKFIAQNGASDETAKIEMINAQFGVAVNGESYVVEAEDVQKYIHIIRQEEELDKTALQQLIEEAKELYNKAEIGMLPGQYSEEAKTEFMEAIERADSLLEQVTTADELNKAIEELNEAMHLFSSSIVEGEIEDVNGDNKVDVADLALIAYYYKVEEGSEDWDKAKRADVNKNGTIDIGDLTLVAHKIIG